MSAGFAAGRWADPGDSPIPARAPLGDAGSMTTTPILQRPRSGRVIAGVFAGLANRFGWSANVLRVLFVLSFLLPGPQLIFYFVAWIIIPNERLVTSAPVAPAPPATAPVV